MEGSCSCCNYHNYNHDRYGRHAYASPSTAALTTQNPSPTWPLVVLCMVFALLMGPMVLELPEQILSTGQILAMCVLAPFVLLLVLHFFYSQPQQEHYYGRTLHSYAYSNGYSSNGGYHHYSSPPTPAEEPLYGCGLFLMFILAILLFPLTRS